MNVKERIYGDINTLGGGDGPPCIGLAPDALPEVQKPVLAENSQTGVSTENALSRTEKTSRLTCKGLACNIPDSDREKCLSVVKVTERNPKKSPHWYALRVTYGRERKAYDYLIGKDVEAFYPTITTVKVVGGKRKIVKESRIPNLFFARGTAEEIESFVYDNVNLPYLRFYYRHFHEGARIVKEPLIVPDNQIESLKIICASEAEDVILVPVDVHKFEKGQKVRIIDGVFKGVVGRVARYQGQQRVAVILEGLMTIASAYVPSAFLKPEN